MSGTLAAPIAGQTAIDAQTAFVALLTQPLLTPYAHPVPHRLARLHFRQLGEWCARCGYRLVTVGQAVRLHRPPLAGQVAHPPPFEPPRRRDLVLTLCAAAACEDTDGTTTVQQLSDQVRALTSVGSTPVRPYNPDLRVERYALVRALARLEEVGVLRRRTSNDEALRVWEEDRVGAGAGYEVDRDALLQLTDPSIVRSQLRPQAVTADGDVAAETARESRRGRLLRLLLETPVVLFDDLDLADADYARNQRVQLAQAAVEMTGGQVQMRDEGMLLILPPDRAVSSAATLDWPRPTAASTLTLLLLDRVLTTVEEGRDTALPSTLPSEVIDKLATELFAEKAAWLTAELKVGPERLRAVAEELLVGAGLIRRQPDGAWLVLPVAARYRDPVVTAGSVADNRAAASRPHSAVIQTDLFPSGEEA